MSSLYWFFLITAAFYFLVATVVVVMGDFASADTRIILGLLCLILGRQERLIERRRP